jgi:hypothetical protein
MLDTHDTEMRIVSPRFGMALVRRALPVDLEPPGHRSELQITRIDEY